MADNTFLIDFSTVSKIHSESLFVLKQQNNKDNMIFSP